MTMRGKIGRVGEGEGTACDGGAWHLSPRGARHPSAGRTPADLKVIARDAATVRMVPGTAHRAVGVLGGAALDRRGPCIEVRS
jgi:hypothetical protein